MGGEFIADDDGVLELRFTLPNGGYRTVRLTGYEPGEEVYRDVLSGRVR